MTIDQIPQVHILIRIVNIPPVVFPITKYWIPSPPKSIAKIPQASRFES